MYIDDGKLAVSACLAARVPVALRGHRGIGKTQAIKQVCDDWVDYHTNEKSPLYHVALYCATQAPEDLIGYPIKIWKNSGNPVVDGIQEDGDQITTWAPPDWFAKIPTPDDTADKETAEVMRKAGKSLEEIKAFYHRPQAIIFLDEFARAQRDVIQAMYPFVLSLQLHMHKAPRGTCVVLADNFAGAYDVKEPDEAFMSRLCHLEIEANIKTWHRYAIDAGIDSSVINFLTSNTKCLNELPENFESTCIPYVPLPDPRSWSYVSQLIKYGSFGLPNEASEVQALTIRKCMEGMIGKPATSMFMSFSSATPSFEDILEGKSSIKKVCEQILPGLKKNGKKLTDSGIRIEVGKFKEKMLIEANAILSEREFSEKESKNLQKLVIELASGEKATAILQLIFTLKNDGKIDEKWTKGLTENPEVMKTIQYLMNKMEEN